LTYSRRLDVRKLERQVGEPAGSAVGENDVEGAG
jgi:hypothetical protein